ATRRIGPADHGRRMSLAEFIESEFDDGWLYELARGVIDVTEVPGPSHGRMVRRLARTFILYEESHPGVIQYGAGGSECRLRLPGMQSDRHPDQAIYLDPQPPGTNIWARWVPHLVVEVVSVGGESRDYVEKRDEYLRAGVAEYWILDPSRREMLVHRRVGDVWEESTVSTASTYRTHRLPGLEVRPSELLETPEDD
ncbi:Uma2 family endonuclease, partial [Singulisphaera rosea]